MSLNLERRVAALEEQLARLQRQEAGAHSGRAWLGDLYGKFADDAILDKAMKLGRKYRKSLRLGLGNRKPNRLSQDSRFKNWKLVIGQRKTARATIEMLFKDRGRRDDCSSQVLPL
jgi:hypothetical protein